jgi:coenzyme PQQ precursor peptide PqqA
MEQQHTARILEERNMAWTTPVATEVCIGMEVTSYESAAI